MSQSALVTPESLPPFEPERALATLEWLRRQNPDEQRATFEYWQRALHETANGEGQAPETQPAETPNRYGAPTAQPIHFKTAGFSVQPIEIESALRGLDVLSDGDPEEQRETFEHLKRALNEERAANGERLLFLAEPVASFESGQPNAYGAPLPPFDPAAAIAFLESLYEGDAEEQYETFEYLKHALNETRAANGERLLFLDE